MWKLFRYREQAQGEREPTEESHERSLKELKSQLEGKLK